MQSSLFINFIGQRTKAFILWLGIVLSLFLSTGAQAATVAVVLSDDSEPYQETADAIERALGMEHSVVRVLSDRFKVGDSALSRAKILVTVGVKAAELVADRGGKTPIVSVLVTEDWYRDAGRALLSSGGRSATALVLDQPISRQLDLVNRAFPNAKKVGVVVGTRNAGILAELEREASAHRLTLISALADSEPKLVSVLGQVLADSDLLLAVPDPDVFNRNTVQTVLMTTYRYRDPVLGYSKALSRAGALVSIYSSPKQIGRQAGEIALAAMNGGKVSGMQWPKYFSVLVNTNVARSLAINVPTEESLLQDLGGEHD